MASDLRGVVPNFLTETYADDTTQPFWDAAKHDRLLGSKCDSCGTVLIPPQPFCRTCQGRSFSWTELPGTGTVYSFTVVRHPLGPELADRVPYAAGVIELDGTQGAGARMICNIIDCDVDTLAIGDRVEIVFEHVNDEMSVPRFRPIRA